MEIEENGRRKLCTSCDYPLRENISVYLDTEKVVRNRRMVFELLLSMAPDSLRIKSLASEYGVSSTNFRSGETTDNCILCGLCVRVCREVVGADALAFVERGGTRKIATRYFGEFPQSCIACGACSHICPTGAISMEEVAVARLKDRWGESRPCRYALMGLTPGARCENDYRCWQCEVDQKMIDRAGGLHPVFLAHGSVKRERES